LLDHRDDLVAPAPGPDDEGKLDTVDQDSVGLSRLLPDVKGALGEALCVARSSAARACSSSPCAMQTTASLLCNHH
jgi:hypothetical protein